MMIRKSAMVLAVSGALAVAAFAAASSAPKSTVTVGEFAVKVTKAIGQQATSTTAAVQTLKSLGVKIDDVNATLTEGMAARILADMGLHASSANPGNVVTPGKADQLVTIVGLSATVASPSPADALPSECLTLGKQGCKTCCWAAQGCDPSTTSCGPTCPHFCKGLPPGNISPSDPNP